MVVEKNEMKLKEMQLEISEMQKKQVVIVVEKNEMQLDALQLEASQVQVKHVVKKNEM